MVRKIIIFILFLSSIQKSFGAILDINEQMLFARAVAEGAPTVDLLIAVRDGANEKFLSLLKSKNGNIIFDGREVGYFRVRIPTKIALSLIQDKTVLSAGFITGYYLLSESKGYENHLSEVNSERNSFSKRNFHTDVFLKSLDIDQEYMNLKKFRLENPAYDGRGVGIAIIENYIQTDAPELSQARTIEGKLVRKIIGIRPSFDVSFSRSYRSSFDLNYNFVELFDFNSNNRRNNVDHVYNSILDKSVFKIGKFNIYRFISKNILNNDEYNNNPDEVIVLYDMKKNAFLSTLILMEMYLMRIVLGHIMMTFVRIILVLMGMKFRFL